MSFANVGRSAGSRFAKRTSLSYFSGSGRRRGSGGSGTAACQPSRRRSPAASRWAAAISTRPSTPAGSRAPRSARAAPAGDLHAPPVDVAKPAREPIRRQPCEVGAATSGRSAVPVSVARGVRDRQRDLGTSRARWRPRASWCPRSPRRSIARSRAARARSRCRAHALDGLCVHGRPFRRGDRGVSARG